MQGRSIRNGVALPGGVAFDGMGHGVHTGGGRQAGGKFFRQSGIQNGDPGDIEGLEVDDFLPLLLVQDHGARCNLRSCSGGRRYGDMRRLLPGQHLHALEIPHASAFFHENAHALGRIDDASASKADHHVGTHRKGHRGTLVHHLHAAVLGDVGINAGQLIPHGFLGFLHQTGGSDTGVGHQNGGFPQSGDFHG